MLAAPLRTTSHSDARGAPAGAQPDQREGALLGDARHEPIGISFPKSGRTWVKAVLKRAGAPTPFTHAGHGSRKQELGRPFVAIPPDLAARRVLFLHRNPIDTAVSFFHQVNSKDFAPGTLKYWQRLVPLWLEGRLPPRSIDAFVLHPNYGVEKICRFNRAWLDHLATRPDALVVTYESLRADPLPGFGRILDWLGRDASGLAEAIEDKSFENMRAREAARAGDASTFLKPDRSRDAGAFKARRGKVGGYADELAPGTVARARDIAAAHGFEV
ncbi:sulfotransferase domain-containing protein [Amaricoccus sp.]|uniref:sulfotransferase domain-containing protein n=1 Tax=Amaricoccus sp. TaxID=1872485 RepID=UPI001B5A102F|nr:sulfotransferase domain-containing protein [Amaricoccus sp.]MBP6999982.1 sulfotransferase domain-containing protein [Amaricoccus sp.]